MVDRPTRHGVVYPLPEYRTFVTPVVLPKVLELCRRMTLPEPLVVSVHVLEPNVLSTSSFVSGTARLGYGRLGYGKILEKNEESNPKHTNDALIGETAIKNDLLLVTNDNRLRKKVIELKGKAMSVQEFLEKIKEDTQDE